MKNMQRLFLVFMILGLLAAGCSDDAGATKVHGNTADTDLTDVMEGDTRTDDIGTSDAGDSGQGGDAGHDAGDSGDTTGPAQPCQSNADCTAPQVCAVDRSNTPMEMTCQAPQPGGGQLGDACSADAECASNLCVEGQCAEPCERPIDCSAQGNFRCEPTELSSDGGASETVNICRPIPPTECTSDADCGAAERCLAHKTSDKLVFECGAPNPGGDVGDTCTADGDCAQNLCLGGVCSGPCASTGDCSAGDNFACELSSVELPGGAQASGQVCAPPRECGSTAECRVGEVCRVDRAAGTGFCDEKNLGGGSLGDICTSDNGCAENLCYEGRFRDVCAPTCADNSDCTKPGYECKTTAVSDGSGGSNSMKICAPKDPSACTSKDDCATGLTCAVVKNAAGTALERACIPSAGKASGVACSADTECAGLVCINGACSDPCTRSNQCGAEQICQSNNVSKDGLSAAFEMCETLLDERCDQDGVCSDGVRMCNEIYAAANNPDAREAYCGMPNEGPTSALGATCRADSECRSNICMSGLSDDCSVVCDRDDQCGPNQVCTPFLLNGTSQIGYCMTSCANNSDCSSLNFSEGGELVDHVCNINIDARQGGVDQTCFRRTPTDSNGSPLGKLGADCESTTRPGEPDSALCQGNMCLTNTLYSNTSCTHDSQCSSGQKCLDAPGGGKKCAEESFSCTRLCDRDNDCTGGEPGNNMTVCSANTTVDIPGGGTESIATCSAAR